MKHLYIIRHGQTAFNALRIVQGKGINSDLDELGIKQSKAFFEYYKHHPFDAVHTSSLKRTIQTVQPFIDKGVPHYIHPELDETGWGILEGKPAGEEQHKQYRSVTDSWKAGNYHVRAEGGENIWEVRERVMVWVNKLLAMPEKRLLICTHGGIMCVLMTIFQQEALQEMHKYRHPNTALSAFRLEGGVFHLEVHGDLSHLSGY